MRWSILIIVKNDINSIKFNFLIRAHESKFKLWLKIKITPSNAGCLKQMMNETLNWCLLYGSVSLQA